MPPKSENLPKNGFLCPKYTGKPLTWQLGIAQCRRHLRSTTWPSKFPIIAWSKLIAFPSYRVARSGVEKTSVCNFKHSVFNPEIARGGCLEGIHVHNFVFVVFSCMFRGSFGTMTSRLSIISGWMLPPICRRKRRIYIYWAWKSMVSERYQSEMLAKWWFTILSGSVFTFHTMPWLVPNFC